MLPLRVQATPRSGSTGMAANFRLDAVTSYERHLLNNPDDPDNEDIRKQLEQLRIYYPRRPLRLLAP